ncbi:MAG: glycerophosphodiester phosphodiesterase family protein [Anaerolineaceae bacterium]|jgi:glycerophosphoryl diester phosphodiesterase
MTGEVTKSKPLIIAHRGASALAPENTMAAFRLAKQLGADGIELDVMLSADEKLVVIHDLSLARTTNGQGKVSEMRWNQLKILDAGSKFNARFAGEPLPLLGQVFEELGGQFLINVELKNYATPFDHLTEKVIALIQKMRLKDSVLLSSFLPRNLRKAERLDPSIKRGLLRLPRLSRFPYSVWLDRRYHYDALHPYFEDVTPKMIYHQHAQNKEVNVWTVDKDEDLLRMKEFGVDMIICNDPAHAREIIGAA